jgi:WD40 repeat protein
MGLSKGNGEAETEISPKTGTLQHTLEGHEGYVNAVAFSPDGKTLASANFETVQLWDAQTGTLQQTLEGHNNCVNAVAFSDDSQYLEAERRR